MIYFVRLFDSPNRNAIFKSRPHSGDMNIAAHHLLKETKQ